jgi:hypothetical protein
MLLRCLSRYENGARQLVFEPGQEFEADITLQRYLFVDAPGCFEEVNPQIVTNKLDENTTIDKEHQNNKIIETPVEHRQVRRTRTK